MEPGCPSAAPSPLPAPALRRAPVPRGRMKAASARRVGSSRSRNIDREPYSPVPLWDSAEALVPLQPPHTPTPAVQDEDPSPAAGRCCSPAFCSTPDPPLAETRLVQEPRYKSEIQSLRDFLDLSSEHSLRGPCGQRRPLSGRAHAGASSAALEPSLSQA